MKNYKIILFKIFLLILISSCSGDEEESSSTLVAATSDFNGTFLGTCPGADSIRKKMVINGDTAAQSWIIYSDSECESENYIYTFNYTVASTATATEDGGKSVTKIQGTTTTTTITPLNDTYVTYMNASSGWCGKTDWVKNTAKDVTGLDCESTLGSTWDAAGVTKYDIWYLSGSTFMNSGFNSTSYSSELSDTVYTKQ